MISEALEAVEIVIWGAVISFGILAALTAFLIIALGYWTGVLAVWVGRRIADRIHPAPPAPEPEADDEPEPELDDDLYAHWDAWNAEPREEKP
ncbi:hypothetical protein [Streptomyces prasinus]|uniref:hypothetical protein n=1 Tax=Streptomyces prasinus TaxID=67345 RepID=UPI0033AF6BEA